ncbi:MAG: hypothetical protein QOI86_5534, partial [Actinomycetota bacterium]|nr:hypothetical protein [Actinomycetota bacterium]
PLSRAIRVGHVGTSVWVLTTAPGRFAAVGPY